MEDNEDSLEVNGRRHQMDGLSELIEQGIGFAQNFVQGFKKPQPEEKKEEKQPEKKEEPKPEVKEEKKVEVKVEEKKPEPKAEEKKPESKVETNKPEPKKPERVENSQKEQRVIENANYLCDIMSFDFTKAYKFSKKYPELTKEELVNIYLSKL